MLHRADMMVILENKLDALVRLHTPWPPGLIGHPHQTPTELPPPGLPFSLVFRADPGKEDVLLEIASAYEAASNRQIPPPSYGEIRLTLEIKKSITACYVARRVFHTAL